MIAYSREKLERMSATSRGTHETLAPGNVVDHVVVIERVCIPAQSALRDADASVSQLGEILCQELCDNLMSLLWNLRDCVVGAPFGHWLAAFSVIGLWFRICVFCTAISNLEHAVFVSWKSVKATFSAMIAHVE